MSNVWDSPNVAGAWDENTNTINFKWEPFPTAQERIAAALERIANALEVLAGLFKEQG